MVKSVLLIFVLLAVVAVIQSVPFSETPKRKLSEDTNIERSRLLEQLRVARERVARERRRVDYYDWQKYLPKCTNCNILAIGNGYKNKNEVTFNGPMPSNWRFQH